MSIKQRILLWILRRFKIAVIYKVALRGCNVEARGGGGLIAESLFTDHKTVWGWPLEVRPGPAYVAIQAKKGVEMWGDYMGGVKEIGNE